MGHKPARRAKAPGEQFKPGKIPACPKTGGLWRPHDAEKAGAGLNGDVSSAGVGRRSQVGPRSVNVVLELQLEGRITVSPINDNFGSTTRDAGNPRRDDDEGFDRTDGVRVVDESPVAARRIDRVEFLYFGSIGLKYLTHRYTT